MINTTRITQIGLLVWDLEAATEKWKAFLGVEPVIAEVESQEITGAMADGKPCYGRVRQALFDLENIQIELIMPINEEYSYWRACLEKNGEGLHHIAVKTDDMEEAKLTMDAAGYPIRQYGSWPDTPEDGQYAYADATDGLKTVIELLRCK